MKKIKTINLLSDTEYLILAGKSGLRLYSHNEVIVNTCEFHVKQKICRTTTDKDLRDKLSKAIYEKLNTAFHKNLKYYKLFYNCSITYFFISFIDIIIKF